MKRKFLKLSLVSLLIGIVVLMAAYFCFHFVTDEGITLVWHAEAGKPVVTFLIGVLGVLFVWASVISAFISVIFFKNEK